MADREFVLKFIGDVDNLNKNVSQMNSRLGGMTSTFKKIGGAIAASAVVDKVLEFGSAAVTSASDLEQAMGGSEAVFKDYAGVLDKFGDTTAENLGISKEQFLRLSTVTGAMMKNAGVPLNEVADGTQLLTTRAADLAAMFGGDVSQAMEAINSALKGEFDPLEQFGVSLKASTIEAKAQAMGLVDADGKATAYGKTMATQALIMEQSADAAGAFSRESDTLAGKQAILKAKWADMQAEIGTKLLPVVQAVTAWFTDNLLPAFQKVVAWVEMNWPQIQATIQPIMLQIQEVTRSVIEAIDWIWTNFGDKIMIGVRTWIDYVKGYIEAGMQTIKGIIDLVMGILTGDWSRAWDGLKNIVMGVFNGIQNEIERIISVIALIMSTVWRIISAPFEEAWAAIQRAWQGAASWFTGVKDNIVNAFTGLVAAITQPFKDAWEGVKKTWEGAKTVFEGIKNGITGVFSGIADIIKAPFNSAFNAIKNLWNNTVGGFGFEIPSWVPGVGGKGFKIPKMAAGGIVTRPTIALIGEAGPEAVVPLGRGGMGNVTINVYALTANAEVGRKVYEALGEYERISGNRIVAAS